MHIHDILNRDATTLSYEFFPPRTDAGWESLFESIRAFEPLEPSFVSVTYGAGGSTRDHTHELVVRLRRETSLDPIPHLTCIGHSRSEIRAILEPLRRGGGLEHPRPARRSAARRRPSAGRLPARDRPRARDPRRRRGDGFPGRLRHRRRRISRGASGDSQHAAADRAPQGEGRCRRRLDLLADVLRQPRVPGLVRALQARGDPDPDPRRHHADHEPLGPRAHGGPRGGHALPGTASQGGSIAARTIPSRSSGSARTGRPNSAAT